MGTKWSIMEVVSLLTKFGWLYTRFLAGQQKGLDTHLSAYQYGTDDTHIWVDIAAEAAADKKGERTIILDVHEVFAITDAFVITSATNDRHVRALADAIADSIREANGPELLHSEGFHNPRWILLDYGTFVVHVFTDEAREYYDL